MLMLGGILAVVVGSAVAWLQGGRYASTDDAYVQAAKLLVTPCFGQPRVVDADDERQPLLVGDLGKSATDQVQP